MNLQPPFMDREATLEFLRQQGWQIEDTFSGTWWFRNGSTHERQHVPAWVTELVRASYKNGEESVRQEIKRALGL